MKKNLGLSIVVISIDFIGSVLLSFAILMMLDVMKGIIGVTYIDHIDPNIFMSISIFIIFMLFKNDKKFFHNSSFSILN